MDSSNDGLSQYDNHTNQIDEDIEKSSNTKLNIKPRKIEKYRS